LPNPSANPVGTRERIVLWTEGSGLCLGPFSMPENSGTVTPGVRGGVRMARQWQQDEQDAARDVGGFREDMDLRRIEMRNPALTRSGREAVGGERTRSLRGSTVGSQGGPKYRA